MNDHPNIPTRFESKRLILRSYQPGDGPLLFGIAQKNRLHLQEYESENALLEPKDEVEAEALARSLFTAWTAGQYYFIGAFDKENGEFVAQVYAGLANRQTPEFEMGYIADVDHEGKGYVTEAVRATLGLIFDTLEAQRVSLHCHPANTRSIRVAERCGFKYEGRLRQNKRQPDGSLSDSLIYSLLRDEFTR